MTTKTYDLIAMPTLKTTESGGEVKMIRPLPDRAGNVTAEIVLAYLPHNRITPYVTWQANTDEFVSTYWGHYFRAGEEEQAVKDFMMRGR